MNRRTREGRARKKITAFWATKILSNAKVSPMANATLIAGESAPEKLQDSLINVLQSRTLCASNKVLGQACNRTSLQTPAVTLSLYDKC